MYSSFWVLCVYVTAVVTVIGNVSLSYSFIMFSPVAYGMSGPKADDPDSDYHRLKWLQTWDI